jgi:hypothetical protein
LGIMTSTNLETSEFDFYGMSVWYWPYQNMLTKQMQRSREEHLFHVPIHAIVCIDLIFSFSSNYFFWIYICVLCIAQVMF